MNKTIIKLSLSLFAFGITNLICAQEDVDKKILNWYNGSAGMKTEKAYKKLKKRESSPVIVAIIDSGVDIEHEDLKDKIWVNKDEIPGNGIDDDKNGYIDDVHGWNFLGNAKGENANDIRLEKTRLYAALKEKFDGKDVTITNEDEAAEFVLYQKLKEEVEEEIAKAQGNLHYYKVMLPNLIKNVPQMVSKELGVEEYTMKDLKKWNVEEGTQQAQIRMMAMLILDGSLSEEGLKDGVKHFETKVNVHLNPDFDGRSIVGDNPNDFSDTSYGNNDVEGPDAFHGTHVAGIVGAARGNDIGADGVADNVVLMSIRAVPNGDEFDKDIALAVRYAVDNGAQVINMSFGKGYSPNAKEVFEAFKYADSKGVLLVHAAGNDHKDIGKESNFPSPIYDFQDEKLDNWLEIGASTRYIKKDELAASFSNYNSELVDVFAPGLEIYNSVPQSDYQAIQGTSMACPMVSGAAAMLKSYFPKMTMTEIKNVLLETATVHLGESHIKPGGNHGPGVEPDMVDFSTLSATGGTINLLEAVKRCLELEEVSK
ncbi:MAG: S8 family peptidase [Crocinitomicaceae bacterium]|nr:S8 family peptidase [Crocinitomicaceae bacterium]